VTPCLPAWLGVQILCHKTKKHLLTFFTDFLIVEGCWLFEMKVIKRNFAMAIGFGSETMTLKRDVEYIKGFWGYYHGGASLNIVSAGKRAHTNIMVNGEYESFYKDKKVGVKLDLNEKELTIYCEGKEEPQRKISMKNAKGPLFPVVWSYASADEVEVYFPKKLS